jgi:hypothetical protein
MPESFPPLSPEVTAGLLYEQIRLTLMGIDLGWEDGEHVANVAAKITATVDPFLAELYAHLHAQRRQLAAIRAAHDTMRQVLG